LLRAVVNAGIQASRGDALATELGLQDADMDVSVC
jgi:hypothetical protein